VGTVYKGVMPSGEIVAVKRLFGEGKGASHDHGFSAEIETLGKIWHCNSVASQGAALTMRQICWYMNIYAKG
jgi:hypothetical protein